MGTSGVVVRSCSVVRLPVEGPGSVLPDQDLHLADGRIAAVVPTGSRPVDPDARVVEAAGLVAMPGLTNAHSHMPMVLMRGAAEDVGIEEWFNDLIWPMEMNLTPDRVHAGARLACAEMLLGGITAVADHYFLTDRIAEAVVELGIRANLAPTYFSSQGRAARQAAVAAALAVRDAGSPLLTASLGPHATYTVDEADLRWFADAAVAEGLPIHIHAAETIEQTRASQDRLGVTPIEVLARTGVLAAGALIAHGTGIVASDLPLLAEYRDRVGVASCPKGYFKVAMETMTPVRSLLEHGIRVGVGTDGAASGNTLDVLEQTRLLALSQKQQERDPRFLTTADALRLATRGGAALVPFGTSGTLDEGSAADVVLVDLGGPHCQPVHDPLAALLYSARASDVRTVIVNGEVVVDERRLVRADLAEIVDRAAAVAPELLARRPGEAVQHYAP
jgi:cytosine/adenosine deaminase-related metal-dependent hydrolase